MSHIRFSFLHLIYFTRTFDTYYLPLPDLLSSSPHQLGSFGRPSLPHLINPPLHHSALLPWHLLTLNLPIPNTPRNLICFV
ncbi:hypothetical protein C358_04255 [Cryptococcus neoformans MW-RSA852]|nr:hypothetical protein C358_04255 [Cryptococcus neoformans var. grubii MW-RSA852]